MDLTIGDHFWLALLEIIGINIILSGDNAVVIALACRNLAEGVRNKAIIAGSVGAILLRIVFSLFIVYLLDVPYLKLVGALLLLYIGVKLLLPEDEDHEGKVKAGHNLWSAVQTVIIADAVMSLDNVVAIAAAAHGHILLIVLGLVISVPLIIFGSAIMLKVLVRFPILVVLGGGLLGWIAGEILMTDPALAHWTETMPHWTELAAKIVGAIFVVSLGKYLAYRMSAKRELTEAA
ncbi:MAG TPA: TerC family protein [Alphaproteobacteria bacterium]